MSRYLNPAKIGLLALIELYVEGAVPSDAILPILSFVTSHLMDHDSSNSSKDQASRWSKAERTVGIVIAIKDFEKLLGSYPFLMGMPGRKLWDQFLGKLWDINSLDAMNEFFENLSTMLARTKEERQKLAELGEAEEEEEGAKLSRTSPFGTFVRRAHLEYQRLQFHDCTELWKNFVRYRQPTSHYLKRKIPGFPRLSFDNVLLLGEQEDWDPESTLELASVAYGDMLTGDETKTVAVSTDDIETLLEFQIEQMQSKFSTPLARDSSTDRSIEYGNRIPLEIRHQFHDLLNDSYLVPSLTHYLKYATFLATPLLLIPDRS